MGREPSAWTIHRDPRTGTYTVRFRLGGKRHHRSTGARRAREAQAEAKKIYAKEARSLTRPTARRGSLEALMAEWVAEVRELRTDDWADTCSLYARVHWLTRWGTLDEVTGPAIQQYISERLRTTTRRGEHVSAVTVRKELSALRRFLRWCLSRQFLVALPSWESPSGESDHQPVCLTREQVAALLAELPDRATHHHHMPVREYFTVMWATSLRHGTLARLRWDDVDLEGARLVVRSGSDKRRYQRVVPLTEAAVAALEALGPGVGLVFGRHDYRRSLRLAGGRAGIPGAVRLTDHALRHSRVTDWASRSRNVAAIQHMAGHRDLATTMRYVHAAEDGARALLDETENSSFRDTSRDTKEKGRPNGSA